MEPQEDPSEGKSSSGVPIPSSSSDEKPQGGEDPGHPSSPEKPTCSETSTTGSDLLQGIHGPMTRSRAKKINEALHGLIKEVGTRERAKLDNYNPKMINVLTVVIDGRCN